MGESVSLPLWLLVAFAVVFVSWTGRALYRTWRENRRERDGHPISECAERGCEWTKETP